MDFNIVKDTAMKKRANLNNTWSSIQQWLANKENQKALIGGGLGLAGGYLASGLIPGVRRSRLLRLLAGAGGAYLGAKKLPGAYSAAINKARQIDAGRVAAKDLAKNTAAGLVNPGSQTPVKPVNYNNNAWKRQLLAQ